MKLLSDEQMGIMLSPVQGTLLSDEEMGIPQAEAEERERTPLEMVRSGLDAFNQSVTFGLWDRIEPALNAGYEQIAGAPEGASTDFWERTGEIADYNQARRKDFRDDHPVIEATGQALGTVPHIALMPGAVIANAARRPVVATAEVAAREGAMQGAGQSDAESVGELLQDTATGAAIGGGVGVGLGGVAKAGGQAIAAVSRARQNLGDPELGARRLANEALAESGTSAGELLSDLQPRIRHRNPRQPDLVEAATADDALRLYDDLVARGENSTEARRQAVALLSEQSGRAVSTSEGHFRRLTQDAQQLENSPLMLGELPARGPGRTREDAATVDYIEALGNDPGTRANKLVRDEVLGRQTEAGERVEGVMMRRLGVDNVDEAIEAAHRGGQTLARSMYGDAFALEAGDPQAHAEALGRAVRLVTERFQNVAAQRGGRSGRELQDALDAMRNRLGTDADGSVVFGYPTRLQEFIDMRADIFDQMNQLRDGGYGAAARQVGRYYRALTLMASRVNPAWARANTAYGEDLAHARFADLGAKFAKIDFATPRGRAITRAVGRLSTEQRRVAALGFVRHYLNRNAGRGDSHNMVDFASQRRFREGLQRLLPREAESILNDLRDEAIAMTTTRRMHNSRTAPRLAIRERLRMDVDLKAAFQSMNPLTILNEVGRYYARNQQIPRDEALARILTMPASDRRQLFQTLRELAEQQAGDVIAEANRQAPRFRAREGARVLQAPATAMAVDQSD